MMNHEPPHQVRRQSPTKKLPSPPLQPNAVVQQLYFAVVKDPGFQPACATAMRGSSG